MRTCLVLFLLTALPVSGLFAQQDSENDLPEIRVEASTGELLHGNPVEVIIYIKNGADARFNYPDWDSMGADLVMGPNTSSSVSIINGKMKSEQSYKYYIMPRDTGTFVIPALELETGEAVLKSEPIRINILPNPDGIQLYQGNKEKKATPQRRKKRPTIRI